ncbi:acyltransferase [Dyadobacter chenwenxiniae]|uniref:Acyltransferase n=1 Tax=Dyadobacter chenwenxiniae TaxID=2906456 RepID=A0A9X1PKD0_9BACT|nr:acyltransferase [Dyadobacter chenwenxiniae]MCF0062670.1 acyltransferase [Dyadobacter chenwenxiniae]UON83586.1 acyltransferase [Dyadobacter chenwenxiniae]
MEKSFRVNNFDLIRIFAAIQVLIFHAFDHLQIPRPDWATPLLYFPGVPIFYTISGYLISASFERSSDLRHYFRNRFLRIFPGLWGCLILTIGVASFFGFSFFSKQALIWLLSQMGGVIYTPEFLSGFGFGSYNGSLWTICVEMQFYFVLPIVYFIGKKIKHLNYLIFGAFFVFLIFAFTAKIYFPGIGTDNELRLEKLLRYSYFPHFYLFLAGVVMQRLQIYKSNWIYGKGLYWVVGFILLKILFPILSTPVLSIFSLLYLSVCTISVAYSNVGLSKKVLKGNDISYGVYIYHGLILNVLVSMGLVGNLNYLWVVILGACILGYLSWVFVEKPFLLKKGLAATSHVPTKLADVTASRA